MAEHSRMEIEDLHQPRTATQLRSLLDLCNMFRLVPNFVRAAAPLNQNLRKDQPSDFGDMGEDELSALASLQKSLTTPLVLVLPRTKGKLTFDTDACDSLIGCVIIQQRPDYMNRPIGFRSRYLKDGERQYDKTHRECQAVFFSTSLIRP